MTITTRTLSLAGSPYEIGSTLGRLTAQKPTLARQCTAGMAGFGDKETEEAQRLFDRWCPGLNEELRGFAETLGAPLSRVLFYAFTYLRPGCSQIALSPSVSANGHAMLARNYEFSHELEDFTLVKTAAAGKYAHLGTSVMLFGRDEGLNEAGLAVSMSSCGFPVGAQKEMRSPKITGLQFWAVIRTLLENCRDVAQALDFLADMPIAYNLNLLLADRAGNIALFETLDGHKALKRLDGLQGGTGGCGHDDGGEHFLCATNHPLLPPLVALEPLAMRHSLVRHGWIREQLEQKKTVSTDDLKAMLLAKYPDGLCCHYYREFFGTIKSLIIDPVDGTMEICWGGKAANGWKTWSVGAPMPDGEEKITIDFAAFDPAQAVLLPIDG